VKAPVRALIVLTIALGGCGAFRENQSAAAKQQYLTAKADCVAEYPNSLVLQSDCRTRAADAYIRPFYRYGDLMTRAQEQRRALAVKADQHEISRKTYDHLIARSDAEIAREEDRRNHQASASAAAEVDPFAGLFDAIGGLFR
jgi:hypothetical protein